MFTLKEWWNITFGREPFEHWDGKVHCVKTNSEKTLRTNETQGYLACYTFTLVTRGTLSLNYNETTIHLKTHDLYIYSPGMPVIINDVSPDYEGICLMVDENTTLETPGVRDMVSMAYTPIVQLSEPKLKLPAESAQVLENRMMEIISYLNSDNIYKQKVLQMLYAVFLYEFQSAQEHAIVQRHIPKRTEEIFIEFNRILPHHYIKHHDIGFYADRLHITCDYLSRIVKRISGQTVVSYINRMLAMEASYMLKTSELSIEQIAKQLNFADSASFSKFFSRMKGMSPRKFREHSHPNNTEHRN